MSLADRLATQPVVWLDGGLASELERRGHDLDDPLWSAALLLSQPDAIAAVHTAYLEAGADVLITASYQASDAGLAARGLSPTQIDAVYDRATAIAVQARDAFAAVHPDRPPALVAASIGPYGATRADGSEYRGDYDLDHTALVEFHRRRMRRLARGADVLACETIPCAAEVRALAVVLAEVLPEHEGLQAWVSMSCRDGAHTSAAEPIEDALAPVLSVPGVVAIGINCTAPRHVTSLVQRIAAIARDQAIVAYPNAGEHWDARAHRWCGDGTEPAPLSALADEWIAHGARIVGGCCRTRPEHIAAMRSRYDQG